MDSEAASVESNVSLEGEEIVLQVINNDDDEDEKSGRNKETGHIRFSLFNEVKYPGEEAVEESDCSDDGGPIDGSYTGIPLANRSEKFFKFVENQDPRKVKSGLTTVGPMKNLDYDPRDLCSPEIDYGKMTPVMSKTLTPENRDADSLEVIVDGNETILPLDDGFLIVPSREIASLTNIKKVREAMYHCNSSFSEEDIDPNLSRPDLKKMASVEDTPVFDGQLTVSIIPLDKESSSCEMIENVQSILSGSHVREKLPVERNYGRSSPDFQEQRDIEKLKTKSSQFLSQTQPETSDALFATVQKDMELRYKGDIDEEPTCSFVKNSDIQSDDAIVRQKSSTLTRVMRKASDKLNEFRREVDDAVRSTKSLPRNTNKIKTGSTISLKSLVEDCQIAGTNMLQKSRSVLKSTQNLIKSLSQPKVVDDNSIDLEEKSRMLIRDDKDYRIERIENFKRFESVKKRDESDLQCNLSHIEGSPKSFVTTEPVKPEQAKANQTTSEKEIELSSEENIEEECLALGGEGDLHPPTLEEDFIMMETIHGVYDSEKQKEPSAECSKDLFTSQRKVTVRRSRGHLTGVDTTSSSSNRRSLEVLTEHIGQSTTNSTRAVHATPSKISLDLKKRRKKKKMGFSSKFKRFWRSAFDKVKISPRKTQEEE